MSYVREGFLKTREKKSNHPDEVRIISISDAHMSCYNPVSWKMSYWEHTRAAIQQVLQFANKVQADAVIWPGDQYHLKTPARNPLYFVADSIELLNEAQAPHYGIGGNHDLKNGSLNGLEGQPLEVLVRGGTLTLLDEEELVILMNDRSLRVAGESYFHGKAEGCRERKRGGVDHLVTLGHFWFGKETGEFYGEPMFGPDWLEKGETDTYVIGHHHADQGIPVVNGKTYVVVGSINRTGSHTTDLDRKPAAAYLRYSKDGMEVKALRPKVLPLEEVLDLEKRKAHQREEKEMKEFIDTLKQTKVTSSDPTQALLELDLPKEVRERAQKYLEAADESR